MATAIPSIACIGLIGRKNNPLHISIFPSHNPQTNTFAPLRTPLQFSLLLSSTLDIFELRTRQSATTNTGLSGEVGLLHAIDERLAAYGFETNTGIKIVVVVDMRGRTVDAAVFADRKSLPGAAAAAAAGGYGLRETELRVVFRAVQSAYVRLAQNPFFEPDDVLKNTDRRIVSKRFDADIRRIGENWTPGVTNL
ncbi:Sedlin [Plectosphaerella cucumerina]|uniref:Sedlin n=1 Tax=Plectosphaerella cucumerina TaxID=40658 RepID=A0A8K0TSX3_9PEZI|nr:Sedlin [Plectosphaerella cucumerina]